MGEKKQGGLRCGDTPNPRNGNIPTSKRTGNPCRKPVVPGTIRCKHHGGTQQAAPEGDPCRGGRPRIHGVYAKRLPKEMREAADQLGQEVGTLENEVMLSRALLADLLGKLKESPKGGYVLGSTQVKDKEGGQRTVLRIRPYAELVPEALERVARAEIARGKLIALEVGTQRDDEPITEVTFNFVQGVNKLGIIEGEEEMPNGDD